MKMMLNSSEYHKITEASTSIFSFSHNVCKRLLYNIIKSKDFIAGRVKTELTLSTGLLCKLCLKLWKCQVWVFRFKCQWNLSTLYSCTTGDFIWRKKWSIFPIYFSNRQVFLVFKHLYFVNTWFPIEILVESHSLQNKVAWSWLKSYVLWRKFKQEMSFKKTDGVILRQIIFLWYKSMPSGSE